MIMSYKQRESPYILLAKRIPNSGAEKIAKITEIKANLNLDSLYLKVNCYLIIDIMCLNLLLNRERVHRIMSACRNILNLFLEVIEKKFLKYRVLKDANNKGEIFFSFIIFT